jgi:thioredoxin-related protein
MIAWRSIFSCLHGLLASCYLGLLMTPLSLWATTATTLEPGLVNPGHHDTPVWFKNSFLDIQEDLQEAEASKKHLILYFYQDGCPYCQLLLEDNFGLKPIAEFTQKHFDVVALNLWGDREVIDKQGRTFSEKQLGEHHGVMYTPTLLFLDEHGQSVLRLNGYYPPNKFLAALNYVQKQAYQKQRFRHYLAQLQLPAYQVSGKLHHQSDFLSLPINLNAVGKNHEKPLLVLFEQKRCASCDELHQDILQRPESKKLLQQFRVLLLDIWSKEPGITLGQHTYSPHRWAKQLGIQYTPSLVFFDTNHHEVFRSEAYLKSFHIQSILDYIASGSFKQQANFQRYISNRADGLREQGVVIDLMQ